MHVHRCDLAVVVGRVVVYAPCGIAAARVKRDFVFAVFELAASALLLNGSWSLSIDRNDGLNFSVKYADFSASTLEAAIESAIVSEGFDQTNLSSNGVDTDEVGNKFQSGTVDIDGTTYTWRVSATALSDKYDIKGLPDTAAYVGIRLTA